MSRSTITGPPTTTGPPTVATEGTTSYTVHPSPLGPLTLMARCGRLTHLVMEDQVHASAPPPASQRDDGAFAEMTQQLDEYFAGTRTDFDLLVQLDGTEFQMRVWTELRAIPYGQTISYGELARRVGSPHAYRAVGTANGHNPLAVVIPCHRVIASDGSLGGYGGGLDRKRWLLALESADGG